MAPSKVDSAHTNMSLGKAAEWFIGAVSGDAGTNMGEIAKRVLTLGQLSNNRDAVSGLESLAICLKRVHVGKIMLAFWQSSYDRAQLKHMHVQGTCVSFYLSCITYINM